MKEENRDKALQDMMIAIRRNTQGSECIDVFEKLLYEIEDYDIVCTVITDMNRFISYMKELFNDVDIINSKELKAQLLTYDFIKPARFFKETYYKVQMANALLSAINKEFFGNSVEAGAKFYNCHSNNRLAGKYNVNIEIDPSAINMDVDSVLTTQEEIRKVFLLWNYCPTIVKAIIQTKRRQLGFDANSKKFK